MKVLLLITSILFVPLTMGTNNNFCKHTPAPVVQLKSFTLTSSCSGAPGQKLDIDVSSSKVPFCMKGVFHITGKNPGQFSLVYAASVSGKIMGFINYYKDLPLCSDPVGGKSCYMSVDCRKVKELLGDPNVPGVNQKCILETGDVSFVIMTSMDGPMPIPSSVLGALSNTRVSSEIDVTDVHLKNVHVKVACISQDMEVKLKG
ncbi:uncharacterized protein LOC111337326 [Stylophora pistillata]|nr:uncharacterized protein LOC111337326 [Stylophora pistillata]